MYFWADITYETTQYDGPIPNFSKPNETAEYTGFLQYIYEQNTYVNAEKTFHFLPWHVERMRNARENRQSETPIEFTALKSQLDQKNIVHLIERPLQVYYRDEKNIENDLKKYNNQLCRVKVSKNALYHTMDIEESVLDIVFVCTGWCCGVDCCHINLTLIITIFCVTMIILSIASYFSFRIIFKKPQVQAFIRTLGTGHRKREIRRLPAQRRVIKTSGIRQARLAFEFWKKMKNNLELQAVCNVQRCHWLIQ
uniref:Uncharacterized protein n=1 Tax=Acrobeloides nanus TaxID=290746 RepID=A0A914ENT0_9BILA